MGFRCSCQLYELYGIAVSDARNPVVEVFVVIEVGWNFVNLDEQNSAGVILYQSVFKMAPIANTGHVSEHRSLHQLHECQRSVAIGSQFLFHDRIISFVAGKIEALKISVSKQMVDGG